MSFWKPSYLILQQKYLEKIVMKVTGYSHLKMTGKKPLFQAQMLVLNKKTSL